MMADVERGAIVFNFLLVYIPYVYMWKLETPRNLGSLFFYISPQYR